MNSYGISAATIGIALCALVLHAQTQDDAIYRIGGGVSQPTVLFKVDPEYSEEARKAKYSGTVMLAITVDTSGKARNILVVKSLGMGLDEKAIEAVEKWKFTPSMKDGEPVNVRAQIEVNFKYDPRAFSPESLYAPDFTRTGLGTPRPEASEKQETNQANGQPGPVVKPAPPMSTSTPINTRKTPASPTIQTGTVVSQQTVTVGSQTYQTLLHGWETRAKTENVVVIDVGQYRYTWVETTRRWVILPVNGRIEFYRDKRVFVVTDDEGYKHKFGLAAEEIRK